MFKIVWRVFNCIDYKFKLKLFYLQILNLLSSLATVLSSLAIAPFVAILFDPNFLIENKFIKNYPELLNYFEKQNDLVLYFSILIVIFYAFSILLNIFLTYFNLKFSTEIIIYFGKSLYNHLINKEWIFYTRNPSTELVSKIHHDTSRLKGVIIDPFIDLITNSFLTLFILITIFLVNPKVALVSLLIFSTFYILFHFLSKKKMRKIGDEISSLYPIYHKSMMDSFSSIRETIIYKKKKYFLDIFSRSISEMNFAYFRQQFYLKLPRNIMEIFAFSFIILITIYFVEFKNTKFSQIGPLLAFYGVCTLKILPSLQKIFLSIAVINSHQSAFDRIEGYLLEIKNSEKQIFDEDMKEKIPFKDKITITNLNFTYAGKRSKGLKDVNMSIPIGKTIGISGVTGSGKSTLVDIMTGFLKPDTGYIKVDDTLLDNNNILKWQNSFTFVPQKIFIGDYTLRENIAFGENEKNIDDKKIKKILNIVCLEEFADNLNLRLGENGNRISGGQQQRIAIARALYKNSRILFLDEATTSLDTFTEKKILNNLSSNPNIDLIITITHRRETLSSCDIIYKVFDGNVEKIDKINEL